MAVAAVHDTEKAARRHALETFVLIKNFTLISMTLLATTVTILAATRVARREGLLSPSA